MEQVPVYYPTIHSQEWFIHIPIPLTHSPIPDAVCNRFTDNAILILPVNDSLILSDPCNECS